jgi:cytochrome c peroxidase
MFMKRFIGAAVLIAFFCLAAVAIYDAYTERNEAVFHDSYQFPLTMESPKGLPAIPWPADNPYSPDKAELGRLLYFDKRLSSDGTVSCASCHDPRLTYGDRKKVSIGIFDHAGTRHAPTVINAAYNTFQFWDGRAKSLEEQCVGPLKNPKEMTSELDEHKALQDCHERICTIEGYRKLFKKAFGSDECSIQHVAKAIATFERTVLSGNAPYDRYMAGDRTAMTAEQIHGLEVFKISSCAFCHSWPKFTDDSFTNIGIGMDEPNPDLGRYLVTKDEKDWGAFKVPTLRESASSYPYMHDGSLATLEEVVDYYDKGGIPNKNLHRQIRPLHLSPSDKKALVAFMHALSGEGWEHYKEPTKFPQ